MPSATTAWEKSAISCIIGRAIWRMAMPDTAGRGPTIAYNAGVICAPATHCRGFQHATRLLVHGVTGAREELSATLDITRGPLELHHPEQAARHGVVGHAGALQPERRGAGRFRQPLALEVRDAELAA